MAEVKNELHYSKEHEWVEIIGDRTVRVGISDFAQHQLGDIVFIELPEPGTQVNANDSLGTIESVKTVSDLYAPVKGTITKVNTSLLDAPEQVNEQPYESGWMVEIETDTAAADNLGGLLNAEQYRQLTEDQ
jgi:glycine cleavage system H protein